MHGLCTIDVTVDIEPGHLGVSIVFTALKGGSDSHQDGPPMSQQLPPPSLCGESAGPSCSLNSWSAVLREHNRLPCRLRRLPRRRSSWMDCLRDGGALSSTAGEKTAIRSSRSGLLGGGSSPPRAQHFADSLLQNGPQTDDGRRTDTRRFGTNDPQVSRQERQPRGRHYALGREVGTHVGSRWGAVHPTS